MECLYNHANPLNCDWKEPLFMPGPLQPGVKHGASRDSDIGL